VKQSITILATLLLSVVSTAVAQTNSGLDSPHSDSEMSLRVPIDRSSNSPPAHVEGILEHCFPRIHGNEAVHFDYAYTGGIFNNARGGAQTKGATSYVGIFDWGATVDTERIGLWKNGTFYAHALFSHGFNPSQSVGDAQGAAVFAYETPAQFSEYWYEHHFFDGAAAVRAGKIDAGVDFFFLESTSNFINSSGTCVPTTGIPTAPNNAWGVVTDLTLTSNLCFRWGLFDADGNANKFWMSESGNVYTAYQVDYHYTLCHLAGYVYAGAWYNDAANTGYSGRVHSGNSGFSVGFEQMLYRTDCRSKEDHRGLTFFAHYSETAKDRDNVFSRFRSAGIQWLGLFADRPDDVFGFGLFSARFNDELRIAEPLTFGSETAYELFYHAHLTENVAIQPVVQYIVHPGGLYRNAFVPGLVFQITF
jgi:porin